MYKDLNLGLILSLSLKSKITRRIGKESLDNLRLTNRELGKIIWKHYLDNFIFIPNAPNFSQMKDKDKIKRIYYMGEFDNNPEILKDVKFMNSLNHLTVVCQSKINIGCEEISYLPPSLTHLEVIASNMSIISSSGKRYLPPNLKYLNFSTVNCCIKSKRGRSYLPDGLLYLKFGFIFNKNINSLPDSIVYLQLDGHFNQEISKYPKCLRYLFLEGYAFNQDIRNLPSGLISLAIGNQQYNKKIELNEGLKFFQCLSLEPIKRGIKIPENLIFFMPPSSFKETLLPELNGRNLEIYDYGFCIHKMKKSICGCSDSIDDSFHWRVEDYIKKNESYEYFTNF